MLTAAGAADSAVGVKDADGKSGARRAGATDSRARRVERVGELWRRGLTLLYRLIGPRSAYAISRVLSDWLYRLLPALRAQSEANAAAALGAVVTADKLRRLARQAFLHRMWNLTDLHLAPHFANARCLDRIGGRLPPELHARLLAAQQRGQPSILLSAYFGSLDLLPLLLGLNGVRVSTLYRPHGNAGFDAFRRRVRAQSGGALVPVEDALTVLPRILEAGGAIALVADHHAARRGIDCTFLGRPMRVPRTVGILAARHGADVAVAGLRRVRESFCFEWVVSEIIEHGEFAGRADAVEWITQRYLAALERLIRAAPEQYMWVRARAGAE